MSLPTSLATVLLDSPGWAWLHYNSHLAINPVQTKAVTSFVSAVLGDALAQRLSRPADARLWRYDWARTARLAFFNGAFMGPLGHYYYGLLDENVLPDTPKSAAAITSKLFIDQMMWAPICTLIFYVYKCFLEGRPRDCIKEVKQKWGPTTYASWKLWIPAHIFNFAVVPTQQRILYANVISVAGTYILSRCAAEDHRPALKTPLQPLRVGKEGRNIEVVLDNAVADDKRE